MKKINYPTCQNGNFHEGEELNLVCLDPLCQEQSLLCAVCFEEKHKTHTHKPLKSIINEVQQNLGSTIVKSSDVQELLQINEFSQQEQLSDFTYFKKEILGKLKDLESQIQNYHETLYDIVSSQDNNIENKIEQSLNQFYSSRDLNMQQPQITFFLNILDQLKVFESEQKFNQQKNEKNEAIQDKQSEQVIPQNIISQVQKDRINNQTNKVQKNYKDNYQELTKNLDKINQNFENKIFKDATGIFKANFSSMASLFFSQSLHSPNIAIKAPTMVQSVTNGSEYRFCLMEPELQIDEVLTFGFRFTRQSNDYEWVAIGICDKNKVVKNNYSFNYSTTEHGSYMISSNSGCWSACEPSNNNVCSAFKFTQNEIIKCEFNFPEKYLQFTNISKQPNSVKKIKVEDQNSAFHVCCLFYYKDYTVEFLSDPDQTLNESKS